MALDQETMDGFNELFESMGEPPEDEDDTEVEDDDQTDENSDGTDDSDTDEESDEDSEEEDSEEEDSEEEGSDEDDKSSKEDKQKAKQNFAFAQQRQKIKSQEKLIRDLGKAIGLDSGLSVEEIAGKVNEVLINKESEKTGVPVETLQEINELRALVEENKSLKRQDEVTGEFNRLIERYNLTPEAIDEFTTYLVENGKNPLEVDNVNIQYEYYQLHEQDILDDAIAKALEGESKRKEKVKDKAASKASDSAKGDEGDGAEITTVAELDKYFDTLEI